MRWRDHASTLSYVVSFGALGALIWRVGPTRLWATFADSTPWLLAAGAAIAFAGWGLLTLKWQLVLRMLHVRLPFVRLLSLNLTAQLWGLLLPAQVGGELYRGGQLAGGHVPLTKVASAAVLDRGSTVVATALVGLGGALLQRQSAIDARVLGGLAVVATLPVLGVLLLRQRWASRLLLKPARSILGREQAEPVDGAVAWIAARPRHLTLVLGLAVLCQVVLVVSLTVWSRGFGAGITIPEVAAALAASALLPYLVPLPGASVWVQQGTFVYLIAGLGVPVAQASAIALSSLVVVLVFGGVGSAIGAACALWERHAPRRPVGGADRAFLEVTGGS